MTKNLDSSSRQILRLRYTSAQNDALSPLSEYTIRLEAI